MHLLPFNDKVKGCELIMPETVFFDEGQPDTIIKLDKQFCLTYQKLTNV